MKIKESYLQEALKADKNDKSNWTNESRRQTSAQNSDSANKSRQTDSVFKDELKFSNILESSTKLQKNESREDSDDDNRREDEKRDRKIAAEKKDSADENLAHEPRVERYEAGGNQTGGQGGFGANANVGGLNLSENFAARSILHIADLERMISTIRVQTALGGKREIILQLKRSVMDGLQVKIATEEGAQVQIEFLAANEKVRAEIEKHSSELAEILRGRGINLGSLKTVLGSDEREPEAPAGSDGKSFGIDKPAEFSGEDDNTFAPGSKKDDHFYKA